MHNQANEQASKHQSIKKQLQCRYSFSEMKGGIHVVCHLALISFSSSFVDCISMYLNTSLTVSGFCVSGIKRTETRRGPFRVTHHHSSNRKLTCLEQRQALKRILASRTSFRPGTWHLSDPNLHCRPRSMSPSPWRSVMHRELVAGPQQKWQGVQMQWEVSMSWEAGTLQRDSQIQSRTAVSQPSHLVPHRTGHPAPRDLWQNLECVDLARSSISCHTE